MNLLLERKLNQEGCDLIFASHRDPASVSFHDLLCDGKA